MSLITWQEYLDGVEEDLKSPMSIYIDEYSVYQELLRTRPYHHLKSSRLLIDEAKERADTKREQIKSTLSDLVMEYFIIRESQRMKEESE